jgi:hypothetical protein
MNPTREYLVSLYCSGDGEENRTRALVLRQTQEGVGNYVRLGMIRGEKDDCKDYGRQRELHWKSWVRRLKDTFEDWFSDAVEKEIIIL